MFPEGGFGVGVAVEDGAFGALANVRPAIVWRREDAGLGLTSS